MDHYTIDKSLVAFAIQKIYILFKFPPFFEHTFSSLHLFSTPISCLSPFFDHTFCSLPPFSHTFSSPLSSLLPFFLTHFPFPPLFLCPQVAFGIKKKCYFSLTLSVLPKHLPFFSVRRLAFGIKKNLLVTLSVVPKTLPFFFSFLVAFGIKKNILFSHTFTSSLFFL